MTAQLSIVIPTFNESQNVPLLIAALDKALAGRSFEVIVVDDNSPDGTTRVARELASHDPRVRCIRRVGRRGLSSAVVEGILSSSAPIVGVIDADMQHDESILPQMVAMIERDEADVVVGTRYTEGGSVGDWTRGRALMSRFATSLSQSVLKGRTLTDPMSGFFVVRRELFESVVPRLSIQGFKILLDFIASSDKDLRIREVPYVFRPRAHGESKLDSLVLWEYGMLLIDKMFGGAIPPRLILFAVVGATGVACHYAVLTALIKWAGLGFLRSQATATLVSMTWNFALNDLLTYRDKRLRGLKWVRGLLTFYFACGIGALANVGISAVLFKSAYSWWAAAGAGVVVGTVFNYVTTSVFTWRNRT